MVCEGYMVIERYATKTHYNNSKLTSCKNKTTTDTVCRDCTTLKDERWGMK